MNILEECPICNSKPCETQPMYGTHAWTEVMKCGYSEDFWGDGESSQSAGCRKLVSLKIDDENKDLKRRRRTKSETITYINPAIEMHMDNLTYGDIRNLHEDLRDQINGLEHLLKKRIHELEEGGYIIVQKWYGLTKDGYTVTLHYVYEESDFEYLQRIESNKVKKAQEREEQYEQYLYLKELFEDE